MQNLGTVFSFFFFFFFLVQYLGIVLRNCLLGFSLKIQLCGFT